MRINYKRLQPKLEKEKKKQDERTKRGSSNEPFFVLFMGRRHEEIGINNKKEKGRREKGANNIMGK